MPRPTWHRYGPSVLGYRPGWLWWAAALVIALGGWALIAHHLNRQAVNAQYIDDRIRHHAQTQGLDVALVRAVVQAESGGDWLAESDADAKGLMQITPIALQDVRDRFDVGRGDLYNVDYNLRVGTLYLRYLLDRFEGDTVLALAAYHMGPTDVARGLRKHPDLGPRAMLDKHAGPKTRAYVDRVLELLHQADDP